MPKWDSQNISEKEEIPVQFLSLLINTHSDVFKMSIECKPGCLGSLRVPQTPWLGRTAALEPSEKYQGYLQ